MDSQAKLRESLHKMIEQVENVSILKAVSVILEREQHYEEGREDFYDTLHPRLKASIDRGLDQIKCGQTVSHEEVRKRYEKWIK